MSRLTIQTIESAPAEARERLAAAQRASGFLPNLLGVLANAPVALEAYQTLGKINARNSLTPAEREVVQLTAATRNGCGFCAAGHTKVALKKARMEAATVRGVRRSEKLADSKLDALASFARAVIDQKGRVSDQELSDFLAAGYTQANVEEVVLGVTLQTLCNYSNNIAQTPINPELQEYGEAYA
ncbi:MAG TPA: carboxymuconolactone decarboxylase family protein [Nevskiaceae bacterium]